MLIENHAQIVQMVKASKSHKTLVLFVDHTNFLLQLRQDAIISGSSLPNDRISLVADKGKMEHNGEASAEPEASS